MNPKERTVLILLGAAFLVGTGITLVRRHQKARLAAASPLTIENPVDTILPAAIAVDLNRARRYELEALPGIGPVLAGRILDYRERHGGFDDVGDLRNVTGIGPKRYAGLKELVVAGPAWADSTVGVDSPSVAIPATAGNH